MDTAAMTSAMNPLGQGFLLCASIIIAFGPQNMFIFRQGLRGKHLFATALFSTLADIVLITLGVGGLSTLIASSAVMQTLVTSGGVAFLAWYGLRSVASAWRPGASVSPSLTTQTATLGLQATIIATLSFSFLNPAAYLDTLMIIGSKSLFYSAEHRLIFGMGAILASTVWFFTLTYGASTLAPVFRSRVAWRALDGISGCIMLCAGLAMLTTLNLSL